jgi:hypothetical protein
MKKKSVAPRIFRIQKNGKLRPVSREEYENAPRILADKLLAVISRHDPDYPTFDAAIEIVEALVRHRFEGANCIP